MSAHISEPIRAYIKFLPFLENWARRKGAESQSWAREVFDDVTDKGRLLTVVPLPGNETGPLVALLGDRFYCAAGKDADRADSLFISKIDFVSWLPVGGIPRKIHGDFHLVTSARLPRSVLSDVTSLFEAPRTEAAATASSPPQGPLHPRLSPVLALLDGEVLDRLAPCVDETPQPDDATLIDALRRVWKRHRLASMTARDLPARMRSILDGRIQPTRLTAADRVALLGAFDVGTVNYFAVDAPPEAARALIADLSSIPLLAGVRARIWTMSLASAEGELLRSRLHHVAPALMSLAGNPAAVTAWEEPIVELIEQSASRLGDRLIGEVASDARAQLTSRDEAGGALRAIAQWAGALRVRDANASADSTMVPESSSGKGARVIATPPHPAEQCVPTSVATHANGQTRSDAADGVSASSGTRMTQSREWSICDSWAISMRADSPAQIRETLAALETPLGLALAMVDSVRDVSMCIDALRALHALQLHLGAALRDLPAAAVLENDVAQAAEAYQQLEQQIGSDAAGKLITEFQALRPDEVLAMSRLLQHRPVLQAMPPWMWEPPDAEELEAPTTPEELAARLRHEPVRQVVEAAINCIAGEADPEELVADLPRPPSSSEPVQYVVDLLRDRIQDRRGLSLVPEVHAEWVTAARERHESAQTILRTIDLLENLEGRLADATLGEVVKRVGAVENPDERGRVVRSYLRATSFFEDLLGTARNTTKDILDQWVLRQTDVGLNSGSEHELRILHNRVDEKGEATTLLFESIPGQPYGWVRAPLLLESSERIDEVLQLAYSPEGDASKAWPADWETPEPDRIELREADWREHPDDRARFVYTFSAAIPIRDTSGQDRLSVAISARNERGDELVAPTKLRWDVTRGDLPSLEWPDGKHPEFVRHHPVGVQSQGAELLTRVAGLGSFAAVAPRRFGKTTLVEYLRNECRDQGFVVPEPVRCTSFAHLGGIDYERLWDTIGQSLLDSIGSTLLRGVQDGLPVSRAFDPVRKAVKSAGKRAILLIFDEAQALFPRGPSGSRLGDRIKDWIEGELSAETDSLAPVLVGFVGLPGLLDRAGSNLMGVLNPVSNDEIGEDALNRLVLRRTAGGLRTTREARMRIARLSQNLLILKDLITRLVNRARDTYRSWVSYDDVVAIEREIRDGLRAGGERSIGLSLRDSFSGAESPNDWEPIDSYPVALALARSSGVLTRERKLAVVKQLNHWAEVIEPESMHRLEIDLERVEQHLQSLRDCGLLSDAGFCSDFVDAWLYGQSRSGYPSDPGTHDALRRAAQKRIIEPPTLAPIGEGLEAKVFRFTRKEVDYAWREIPLRSSDQQTRFRETCLMLDELVAAIAQREHGYQYVFDLCEVGLKSSDSTVGVQVYRWIEGRDLATFAGSLDERAVVGLGQAIASAIAWMHDRGILHRDIRPANIVLREQDQTPILIDFGLARIADKPMTTQLASEFAAPEVRSPQPRWSKAADIWALGRTLSSLLNSGGEGATGLLALISDCTRMESSDRPKASDVARRLDVLCHELRVEEERQALWNELCAAAQGDSRYAWYQEIINRFKDRFCAFGMGLHGRPIDRARELADFLNQVLEARPGRPKLSLGEIKSSDPAVELAWSLRNDRSHGGRSNVLSRLRDRRRPEPELRAALFRSAELAGNEIGLGSLRQVVEIGWRGVK